jgi:hypothetical protein
MSNTTNWDEFFKDIDFTTSPTPPIQNELTFYDPFDVYLDHKASKDLAEVRKLLAEAEKTRNLKHNPDTNTYE